MDGLNNILYKLPNYKAFFTINSKENYLYD